MSVKQMASEAEIDMQNIGGIDKTSVVFDPGVTILASGVRLTERRCCRL
jgi:hypothetical protein